MFLFGEVKTSGKDKYPPSVLSGRRGLYEQMNAITSSKKNQRTLITWLLRKIGDADYTDWLAAYRHYKRDEFRAVGILVRSTKLDERDVQCMLDKIQANPSTFLDVLAIYIPTSLDSFVRMVATT